MKLEMKFGDLIQYNWQESREGREFAGGILRRNRRKIFGLLDGPNIPPHLKPDEVSYKIFLCGKAGVGKTALVSKLVGREVPKTHNETPGIQTSIVYWPARLRESQQVLLFKLVFWDVGEHALKKFDHILPACKEDADAVIFVFSLINRASWEDLPALITRTEVDEGLLKVAVGTRYDQKRSIEINRKEIRDFEKIWKIPVLKSANIDGPWLVDGKFLDGRAGIKVASLRYSLRKTVGKVSPILVTLTSCSDSDFERSNVSLKENKPDGVDPNSDDIDNYVRKNEGKILWFSADWEVAPFLNSLCELLWSHDQMAAGIATYGEGLFADSSEDESTDIAGSHRDKYSENSSLTGNNTSYDETDDIKSITSTTSSCTSKNSGEKLRVTYC